MGEITSLLGSIHVPFSGATWFVIFTLGFFVWLFAKANKNGASVVQWEHLIVDSQNNRASPYKVGYLVGIIVATWIVITISDTGELTLDIFGAYLTFLLGGAGINSFTKSRDRFDMNDRPYDHQLHGIEPEPDRAPEQEPPRPRRRTRAPKD